MSQAAQESRMAAESEDIMTIEQVAGYLKTSRSTLYPLREFDFMLRNPPYGKGWKSDLKRLGGQKEMRKHSFMIEHADDPEFSLITYSSNGQMLLLANRQSGCPAASRTWSN